MLTFKQFFKSKSDEFDPKNDIHKDTHEINKTNFGEIHKGVSKKTGGRISILKFGVKKS